MIHQVIKPSGILAKYISAYHLTETNGSVDYFPKHRVYTYGSIVLVFHYATPSLFQERNGLSYIEPRLVLCGQQTSYYDLALAGKTGMIFVVFQPVGAGMFFKIPMSELENQNIALDNIIQKEADELEDKLLVAKSNKERIQLIENFLYKKLILHNKEHQRISATLGTIKLRKGQISINELAGISCLSIKQFERKFSELVGLKPKQYLRIVRFQEVQKKRKNGFKNYTSLALDCGYYDQSHFIHDFKKITDLSPKEFFSNQSL